MDEGSPSDELYSRELVLRAADLAERQSPKALERSRQRYGLEVASVAKSMKMAGLDVSPAELMAVELEEGVVALIEQGAELAEIAVGYGQDETPLYVDYEGDLTATEERRLDARSRTNRASEESVHDREMVIPVVGPRGPGSTHNGSWSRVWDGTMTIIWSGRGEALSFGWKDKLVNDGWSNRDYFGYRRKVAVQPYDVWGRDWAVTGILAAAYPTDHTVENKMLAWEDFAPDNDLNGNCTQREYAIDKPKGGLGVNFPDCDKHVITFRAGTPGWFEIFYSQGAIFHRGNRSTGFTVSVRVKNGTTPYWSDKTRLEFARWAYPAQECTRWGSSGTTSC